MASKKYDIKKDLKDLYKAKNFNIIDLPEIQYISIEGAGNPNSDVFSHKVEALYAVAYTIRMSYRNDDFKIEDYVEFVVPPLEGEWDTIDNSAYDGNKEKLKYRLMIAIPSFVNEDVLDRAKEIASKKKKLADIKDVHLFSYPKRKVCVYLHLGFYDDEPESFQKMMDYVKEKGYTRSNFKHREVYLSDPRKTESEKLKTVLEFAVE